MPIYARTVEDFAQSAAFIQEVSGGRFRFGIGVSHGPSHIRMGVTPGKPLGDTRKFVERFRAHENLGGLPPITLATLRVKMIELAGEIAEGMVFANGSYLGGAEHNRETIIPTEKSRRLAARGVQLEDIFDKSIVRLQAALISKSCYQAVGGHDESLRISMDLDLAFRLMNRYPVAYLDEVVFYYRKHGGNISGNQELRLLENIRVIEKLLADNPKAEQLLGARRVAARLAYRYYRLAKGRWQAGQKEQARQALRSAVALRPLALKYRLYQMRWA